MPAGDSDNRRTEVRSPVCCDVVVCEETEVGLGEAEPGKDRGGRERDQSGCIHHGTHRQAVPEGYVTGATASSARRSGCATFEFGPTDLTKTI